MIAVYPYLLGDLRVLLGALESAAAGSGVLLHRSQYTALKPAARYFFLLARSEQTVQGVGAAQQSEIRTGPCTILSVLEVIWGEELVEILGRKEMGILRRAELEGLHFGRAIRDWLRSSRGCRIVNLGARCSASGTGREVSELSNLILRGIITVHLVRLSTTCFLIETPCKRCRKEAHSLII